MGPGWVRETKNNRVDKALYTARARRQRRNRPFFLQKFDTKLGWQHFSGSDPAARNSSGYVSLAVQGQRYLQ